MIWKKRARVSNASGPHGVLPLKQLGYRFPDNVVPIPHGRVSFNRVGENP